LNPISVLILVLIVVAAIFVITYVAHDRGSSMCSGCHGDCANLWQKAEKEIEKRVPLCRDEITLCVIVSHE